MPFKLVDKDSKFKFQYPKAEIKNQRNFFKLINKNEKITAGGVKSILKSISNAYAGENFRKGNLDDLEPSSKLVDIDWIIKHQFLDPIVKKDDDFQNISTTKTIEMKNYIRQVAKYDPTGDLDRNPRIYEF